MDQIGFRRLLPMFSYDDPVTERPRYEVIHDGETFTADFSGTRVAVTDGGLTGYEYDVKRTGGFPVAAGAAIRLVPFAFDSSGNEPA